MKKHQILLIVLVFAVSCKFLGRNSPTATVESFYKDICDGKVQESRQYLSSTVKLHESVTDLIFQGWRENCKRNGGFKQLRTEEKFIDKKTAGVVGNAIFQNSSKETIAMKLYLENGNWKIAWEIK